MAERSKAAVLKIARPRKGSHGFESHSLRCDLHLEQRSAGFMSAQQLAWATIKPPGNDESSLQPSQRRRLTGQAESANQRSVLSMSVSCEFQSGARSAWNRDPMGIENSPLSS